MTFKTVFILSVFFVMLSVLLLLINGYWRKRNK